MRNPVRFAIVIVLAHLAISVLHGAAHHRLEIGLSRAEELFVWIDIVVTPLLAAALLLTKWRRTSGWLLAISMAGVFIFGVYKHLVAAGADNAFGVASGAWGTTFQITALLLALAEALACWAGVATAQQVNR
jgi:hypothetical protein